MGLTAWPPCWLPVSNSYAKNNLNAPAPLESGTSYTSPNARQLSQLKIHRNQSPMHPSTGVNYF